MKRTVIWILTLLMGNSLVYSQSWSNSSKLSGTNNISIISTASDSYNNTYLFGYFEGSIRISESEQLDSRGSRDLFLAKYSNESEILWIKGMGSNGLEFSNGGICISRDEHVFITGGFRNSLYYSETDSIESTGLDDIFLAKYSFEGENVWFNNIGKGQGHQRPTSLGIDLDGNLLLGGYFKDSIQFSDGLTAYADNSFKDYFLAKFEPTNGIPQWYKSFKSIDSNYSGFIFSITATDNNYYFSGVFADSVQIENDTIVSATQNQYDTHIFKTNKQGDIEWLRLIKGANHDYSYTSSIDADENVYVTGYFNSPQMTIDSTVNESIVINQSGEDYDFYIAKYDSQGTLDWIRVNGGGGRDRLLRSEIYDNLLHVSGYFADTIHWGGIELTTNGLSDQDMFTGIIDLDGNYRSANSFGGTNNSEEAGIAVFNTADKIYQVIRSNSELLVLGDSIYTSSTGFDYIVIGVIACLPISIDNTIYNNVATCYGDSTGSIQISATGGFGSPWEYSIDNGMSYSDQVIYTELPAGDYQVVVIDKENCAQTGPLVTLAQPDSLEVELVSSEDITADQNGSIVVVANGGTAPYTYYLVPDGALQAIGTFSFVSGDSGKYVVAVNDLNGCGPVMTDSIKISEIIIPDGIENAFGLNVKVYPNPTSGIITLEMPFEGTECEMEVLSMTGQVVLKRRVFSNGGVLNESIDLSDQAKGLYMLRVDGVSLRSAIMVK